MIATKKIFLFLFFGLLLSQAFSQSNPITTRPDITVSALKTVPNFASGIAYDPYTQKLHYCCTNGDVYRVNYPGPAPVTDTLLYTVANHQLTILKGLMFIDSTIYLIGNEDDDSLTQGKIIEGRKLASGVAWSTTMNTALYPLGDTFFDHGFSGMCLSPGGDSIYINSGSRTDHGEEQNNNGYFPGAREVPLTSAIFKIPIQSTTFFLPGDSASLAPYLFADGTRNTFKMAFNANNHLIGCENSGDSDDLEELNYLKQGLHYGFPWNMGGNFTQQQFPGYDPATDFMINHQRPSYINGNFYNDPGYPQMPSWLNIEYGIPNSGPHADKFRYAITGEVMDASDLGNSLYSFTTHRSPLGLVFDKDSLLVNDLKGHGFVFSNSKQGDSLGVVATGGFGTLLDAGEDMLDVNFNYNSITDSYTIQTTELITGFTRPVDACMLGTKIYLLEHGRPGAPASLYEISMPENNTSQEETNWDGVVINVYPNPANEQIFIEAKSGFAQEKKFEIYDTLGKLVDEFVAGNKNFIQHDISNLSPGVYLLKFVNEIHSHQFIKL